jgi:CRP-like cAMP-binding protein
MDVREFLKGIPEFQTLKDEDIDRVARIAKRGQVKAGQPIDVQGEPADRFYILETGRLGIVLDLDLGVSKKSYVVTTIGPGDMFAWSGLVGNPNYTAGSRAMTDCTFVSWKVDELVAQFDEDTRLGYVMIRTVARTIASRLRAMQLQLVQQYALSEAE